jgi:DNA polymerase-4
VSDRTRAIIHLDLDAFYAAVEVLENPDLAGEPLVVGGRPSERGVVAAASYPAREFGIRSAMPMHRALGLCPELIIVPPRHGLYGEYSRRVMDILHQTSDLVEQMSIDEAFLDLTEQISEWDEAPQAARALQGRVMQETQLSASLGVATNKLLAKVASDHQKPGGLTVVRPGEEAAFLAPLPVRVLWGVGPVTAGKLAEMGVSTVGDLAAVPLDVIEARFGQHGADMLRRAQGIDERKVVTSHERKSLSQERTFARDLRDGKDLRAQIKKLSSRVARHLEGEGLVAGTVSIKLRYADFTTLSRQMSLAVPTCDERVIYRAAFTLLRRSWERGRPVRLLGVGAHNLHPPTGQLPLF